MDLLKKAVTVKGNAIYDIETLFSRLLVVGQQRSIDIADVFQFELNPVPPALIDEYGCLKKGDKAVLVKSLSVSVTTPCAPDVVPASFCTTSAGQSPGLQETWLQASALDWPTTLLSPRESFFSTDMTKMLPAQRTTSGREEEESRKSRSSARSSWRDHAQLQETAYTFFLPLYGQKGCTTMNDARAHFYRGHKKPPPVKKLPQTDANLQLHVLRAHIQMLL
ncbi:hypothetical protein NP493_1362g01042 [Ridgeia piscesae]|uniref:Uncharacterized protein n=1 Tax=Ridgeia piscesae TaxID=27915 RepID=A0AAD9NFR2_RIDPI|nr:hypothetical protein NP493_1362g01042 [Ridgeia piscesae]